MKIKNYLLATLVLSLTLFFACTGSEKGTTESAPASTGLKIAYVNGDSILIHFAEFRKESEAMEVKQAKAEDELQQKAAVLEQEIMSYQQKAQSGTMTGKEMEAREKYLSSRQEAILGERDRMAREIMEETTVINDRLQAVLQEKLNAIKKEEGYDFILSYVAGGPILLADEKYDITDRVLKLLNASSSSAPEARDSTQ